MAPRQDLEAGGAAVSPREAGLHYAALLAVQASYAWTFYRTPWLGTAVLIPLLFRLTVWTLPVILWILARRRNPLLDLRLYPHVVRGLAWGTAVSLLWVAADLIGRSVLTGAWHLNFDIGFGRWVNGVILVGLSEEVVFRGFYLPALTARFGFHRANAVQSLMFLGIHLPGWTLSGQLLRPGAVQLCASIAVFGLIAGLLLRRSRSLWACMLFHSFNNLASFISR